MTDTTDDSLPFEFLPSYSPPMEDLGSALDNTERRMLRELAQPGAPLWKIHRYMIDYANGLRQSLEEVDLGSPSEIEKARKVQATIIGIRWLTETLVSALTLQKEIPND